MPDEYIPAVFCEQCKVDGEGMEVRVIWGNMRRLRDLIRAVALLEHFLSIFGGVIHFLFIKSPIISFYISALKRKSSASLLFGFSQR